MKHKLTTEEFNKLSRSKRAVLVAKDVIKQIESKLFKVSHGYCTVKTKQELSADAATILRSNEVKCEGCARGALFISAVKFKNKLSIQEVQEAGSAFGYGCRWDYSDQSSTDYLSDEFSRKQQALIETVYEGTDFGNDKDFKDVNDFANQIDKCLDYRKKIIEKYKKLAKPKPKLDNYVLISICKNIIKNNGTFKP